MISDFSYFVKVNVALVLFYVFYRLFFCKDTFFKLRRTILLVFYGVSALYPLMNIEDWVRGLNPVGKMVQVYAAMLPEIAVGTESLVTTDTNWIQLFFTGITYLYGCGLILLFIRFFVQLGSIFFLVYRSKVAYIHDRQVYLLNNPAGPFSFFHYIFLYPENQSEKEIDEILIHECTHVNQWHSLDVLISELVCIFCWVNPFAWLLKKETRYNLEYLADDTVLKNGFNSKNYQYHLLKLAHVDRAVTYLSNNFNMSHLKNRIQMMNKKRTPRMERMKYLIFVPLITILLIVSNIDTLARFTGTLVNEVFNNHALFEEKANRLVHLFAVPEKTMDKNRKEFVSKVPIFTVVQEMPEFPGGVKALIRYLAENIKYPEAAIIGGAEGRVTCSFIVGANGAISNVEILRGVDPSLDAEAVRILQNMPRWSPGKQKGIAVDVKYTVPITFRHPKNIKRKTNLAQAYE